jgi:hypothetical protein
MIHGRCAPGGYTGYAGYVERIGRPGVTALQEGGGWGFRGGGAVAGAGAPGRGHG